MPSLADPSGEILRVPDFGLFTELVDGDAEMPWSDVKAVVAAAFALPGVPTKGILAADNLDAVDSREAREPGLIAGCPPAGETACTGDGGGGDVGNSEGVEVFVASELPAPLSGGA